MTALIVTPTVVPVREACRDAVERVQAFPTARGGSLREAVNAAVAAARAGGARIEVDGWAASGPPPPCQVQFNYRADGQSVRLRWELDPTTGEVTPLEMTNAIATFAAGGITQTYLERILSIGYIETQLKLQVHFLMLVATGGVFVLGVALSLWDFFFLAGRPVAAPTTPAAATPAGSPAG